MLDRTAGDTFVFFVFSSHYKQSYHIISLLILMLVSVCVSNNLQVKIQLSKFQNANFWLGFKDDES